MGEGGGSQRAAGQLNESGLAVCAYLIGLLAGTVGLKVRIDKKEVTIKLPEFPPKKKHTGG